MRPRAHAEDAAVPSGEWAWADYLLSAAGLTLVAGGLLVLLAQQVAPMEQAGVQAALAAQARAFSNHITQVAGSVLSGKAEFRFSGALDAAVLTGEDVLLDGGGVRFRLTLAVRVYPLPMVLNDTRVNSTVELREHLNATCACTGEWTSPLPGECWNAFREDLRRDAAQRALTPMTLDLARPVALEKVYVAHVEGGEVRRDALILVHQ